MPNYMDVVPATIESGSKYSNFRRFTSTWPVSSVGQSVVLITRMSWVRSPYWPRFVFLHSLDHYQGNFNTPWPTCILRNESRRKNPSLTTGFEPVRAEPNGFQVHRLNHSATSAVTNIQLVNSYISPAQVLSIIKLSKCTLPTGFEPVRAEPNGFRVHRLNHSATTAVPSAW